MNYILLKLFIENLKSQNKVLRSCVISNLLVMFQVHFNNKESLETIVDLLEEILKIGLLDADRMYFDNNFIFLLLLIVIYL